jgi:hypothetical protein
MKNNTLPGFIKNPLYEEDPNPSLAYRMRSSLLLLFLALGISVCLGILIGLLGELGPWNLDEHVFDALLEQNSAAMVLVLAALLAPVLEELIFRGPMWFFRNSRSFPLVFYSFTLAFALVHLGNFPNLAEVWPISPLLVSPQLVLGVILGFIRVRFGLLWAIGFHMVYNAILIVPMLLLYQLGIPIS